MSERVLKYKAIIIHSLLFAYLACAFQSQLLNGLHYLAHFVQDLLPPAHLYGTHTHQGDDGLSYQHKHQNNDGLSLLSSGPAEQHLILNLLSELLSNFSDEQAPTTDSKKKSKKKQPEQKAGSGSAATLAFLHPTKFVQLIAHPCAVFQTVPSPPPKA